MKKKGFTLIELIVVIAIIGVLAAILIPSMLGYIKKAKITAANSSASEVIKTMNALLSDDVQSEAIASLKNGDYCFNSNVKVGTELEKVVDENNNPITDHISTYNDAVAGETFAIYIKDGVVVACAAKNGKYFGTSPIVLTSNNYKDEMNDTYTLAQALDVAKKATGLDLDAG